jgi:hypothetical protein
MRMRVDVPCNVVDLVPSRESRVVVCSVTYPSVSVSIDTDALRLPFQGQTDLTARVSRRKDREWNGVRGVGVGEDGVLVHDGVRGEVLVALHGDGVWW